jgi:hypothetical protein
MISTDSPVENYSWLNECPALADRYGVAFGRLHARWLDACDAYDKASRQRVELWNEFRRLAQLASKEMPVETFKAETAYL